MVKQESFKSNLNAFQVDPTSADIFFSGSERPVDNSHSPLVYHAESAGPLPIEVANIPFQAVKHPDDINPEIVTLRNRKNAIAEALRLNFTHLFSGVIDYESTRKYSTPKHKRSDLFFH